MYGLSDHDLMFTKEDEDQEDEGGDMREAPPNTAAGDYNTEAIRANNDWRQHASSTPNKR